MSGKSRDIMILNLAYFRSAVAEFLLKGGQSQSWLLGNRIITITTSGGQKVGRAGLCEKCLLTARVASSKFETPKLSSTPELESGGRRRHKSAAVRTVTEAIPLKPLSQDDILLHNLKQSPSSDLDLADDASGSFDLHETDVVPDVSISREQVPLDTTTEKMQAMDNVLMSKHCLSHNNLPVITSVRWYYIFYCKFFSANFMV